MLLDTVVSASLILASAQGGMVPEASWCTPPRPPVVQVGLIAPTPTADFSKTMKQLETFRIDTKNPYGAHVDTHVGGLTSGTVKVEQTMAVGGVRHGDDICVWPTRVSVTLRLDQRVYVARDYPPRTCMHNAVWDHEHKHIRVDREIINQYRPVYERAVRAYLQKNPFMGPFPKGQEKAAQSRVMAGLRDAISAVTKRMEKDRGARQQAVDTRVEYDRVAALCAPKR